MINFIFLIFWTQTLQYKIITLIVVLSRLLVGKQIKQQLVTLGKLKTKYFFPENEQYKQFIFSRLENFDNLKNYLKCFIFY